MKYFFALIAGLLFYFVITGEEWLLPGAVTATFACIDTMLTSLVRARG